MALPKEEGGLGLRDFRTLLALAASMKRARKLWNYKSSIWAEWMRECYIMGNGLNDIEKRPSIDSALWAGLLDDRNKFNTYLICNPNYVFQWVGFGINFSFKNAVESVRKREDPDSLSKGIWSSKIGKHDMTLWRARRGRITTRYEAATRPRSGQEDTDCLLCDDPMESQTHLFFWCEFAQGIWKELRRWKPDLFTPDTTTLEDFMEQAERRTTGAPC